MYNFKFIFNQIWKIKTCTSVLMREERDIMIMSLYKMKRAYLKCKTNRKKLQGMDIRYNKIGLRYVFGV